MSCDIPEGLAVAVPPAVREACRRLHEAGNEAYIVGGAVRDLLLGRPVTEWDLASDALPERVMEIFRRTIPTGLQHGTVTALVGRGRERMAIEITTYRGEGAYSDARRPDEVRFGVGLEEDLRRRDFVINAIAYDPERDRLCDPLGGRADLAARRLRAVGDPAQRFGEDGLRVMRAVRFVAVLDFELERETERAIAGALLTLARVSRERIRDELLKLLAAPRPSLGLSIAARTDVIGVVLPALADVDLICAMRVIDLMEPSEPLLRLAALVREIPPAEVAGVLRDLRLANEEQRRVLAALASSGQAYDSSWSDADVRRYLATIGRSGVADVLALRRAVAGAGAGDLAAEGELESRAAAILAAGDPLTIKELAIGGREVMACLGIGGGPEVGERLAELLERALVDPRVNTSDRLTQLLVGDES